MPASLREFEEVPERARRRYRLILAPSRKLNEVKSDFDERDYVRASKNGHQETQSMEVNIVSDERPMRTIRREFRTVRVEVEHHGLQWRLSTTSLQVDNRED